MMFSKKNKHDVSIKCFNILNYIGEGGYGEVYQVRKNCGTTKNTIYAMKVVEKDTSHVNSIVHTEVNILKSIKHQFIIELFYAFQSETKFYMVMDYACRGTLCHLLSTKHHLEHHQVLFYMQEVILAIEHLHSKNVVHRDLKPENILIDISGHTKLIDFGISSENFSDSKPIFSTSGSANYKAPEVYAKLGHGKEVDWWALGVMIYKLLSGSYPFCGTTGKDLAIEVMKYRYNYLLYASPEAEDLINKLLQKKANQRLGHNGAWEIKIHPFFAGTSWSDVLNGTNRVPPIFPKIVPTGGFLFRMYRKLFRSGLTRELTNFDKVDSINGNLMSSDTFGYNFEKQEQADDSLSSK